MDFIKTFVTINVFDRFFSYNDEDNVDINMPFRGVPGPNLEVQRRAQVQNYTRELDFFLLFFTPELIRVSHIFTG